VSNGAFLIGGVPQPGVPVAGPGGTGTTAGANIFQGLVTGNQVVFNGIPVLPPASAGATRVYRITNIRTNANGVSAGGGVGTVTASISINSATSLLLNNSLLTVGYVTPGLNASLGKPGNGNSVPGTLAQCVSAGLTGSTAANSPVALLTFAENFATAFKVRGSTSQNIPGSIFNSESGFTVAGAGGGPSITSSNSVTGSATFAGLADYGTRLKATFTNVPSGVSLYVSTKDVVNDFLTGNTTAYPNYQAVLVLGETAVDTGFTVAGTANSGTTIGVASTASTSINGIGIAPVGPGAAANSYQAVWEVINTNPAAIDTINFGLFVTYTAAAATNLPAPGTMSVTFSYAPTPSGLGVPFTTTTGPTASSSFTIPRFSDSLDVTKPVFTISPCTTALLFPYVINISGFDTGIAIANTSTDNLAAGATSSVSAQAGTCSYYFYGSSAPTTNPFVTPSIATATDYANLASVIAPGFSGYMIANCNFQYAHGFAFVSDVGARNLAMGYLPLILLRTGTTPENLNN